MSGKRFDGDEMKAFETPTEGYECLVRGGEMGTLMRSYDWSKTPFGSVAQWPQSLRSTLSICLNSRFPIAIYWGSDCLLLYNDAWRPIVGDKHPWSLGRPAREVWPEIWNDIGPEFATVLATGEGIFHSDELLAMYRYGYTEECFFDYTFNPIQGQGGAIDGILNIVSETTYRVLNDRRAQLLREVASRTGTAKTVEEACELMATALQSDPADIPLSLIYLIGSDGKQIRLCNGAELTLDRSIAPAVVDLDGEDVWSIARVARTARPVEFDDLVTHFGVLPGSPWPEPPQEAIVLPIAMTGQGKVFGVLVAVANPRRRLDDNYREFFTQVAVQIATAIANARSYEEERQRAEQLAELDRAKTVFFSNISHEFRTPLTLMLSPVEDALQEAKDLEQRDRLEMIHRNALRLQKLVNTLLDFSRIEAGRIEAIYEPTDLASLTIDLAGVFRSAIERVGLHLRVECAPLPEPVYVDRQMWEKIVLNLLSNAFKFTFEGEIAVRLRPHLDRIELAVQDTGTGIPAAELPHIFERFHRVKGAKGRSYEGSGIGLSLVQELVKLHGGTIEVSSEINRGTCFTVAIPTGCAHLPSDRIQASRPLGSRATGMAPYIEEVWRWLPAESAVTQNSNSLSSTQNAFRILVADDNADMRDYLKRLLSQQYDVQTVGDGVAALAAICQQMPDLLLTDVMMPEMNGFELLRSLRSDPTTQDIPIILLSARAGEESRIEGLAAGADDYLIKPFAARELLARVEASLKLARLRQEAAQKEQALRVEVQAAKDSLEKVLTRITDQFLALDRQWRYTYVNDRVTEVTGMTKENLLGKCVWDVFPDIVETEFYTEVHRAVVEQTAVQFEYFYPLWNRWFENHVHPSADGVSILVTDISDRKRAEAAIQASNKQFKLLAESASNLLQVDEPKEYLASLFKKIAAHLQLEVYFNYFFQEDRQRLELYTYGGVSAEVAAAAQFLELGEAVCGYVVQQRCPAVIENALDSTDPLAISLQSLGLRAYASHPLMVGDRVLGALGLGTRQRDRFTRDELDLMQAIAAQVAAALERSRLLAELQARAEALGQANRIKDEFLAVLSHELRSPLNPILGWSSLLLSKKLDAAKTAQALATIQRNAKLQLELIEDLLDVSRILQGKLSLNMAPVNLASTIQAAMETVRLAAEAKSIQVHTQFQPDAALVLGDSTRLQQVIWNLLSNAVKFTPEGGEVRICLERLDSGAQIVVSDTGQGIAPEFLPYVFDYFRQADGATTRKFGGLGLGLAIVRHLVELHGGTVRAESPGEGQGATFLVRLPLMPTQSIASPDERSPKQSLNLSGINILVVDDEADTRELIAFFLEQQGAQVKVVSSARQALEVLAQFQPDLLLSDIGMPEMDGYMLIQQVRALAPEQGGQIPAIALTAYAGEINHQQAIAAGFQQHISKPIEPETLVQVISKLIEG